MPRRYPFTAGILLMGDNHAGHLHAPTPPGEYRADPNTPRGRVQAHVWDTTVQLIARAREYVEVMTGRPPSRLLHLGDAIDGKGARSGGTEQVEMDRYKQARLIAAPLILAAGCSEAALVYGTPYHTGVEEDHEDAVVDALRAAGMTAHISAQLHVCLGGVTLHCKHHVGGSSIPHGVHTASAREREVHLQWERDAGWPAARVTLRGHTHRYHYEGTAQTLSVVLPALLPPHTKYGGRRCFTPVDFGVAALVYGGDYGWGYEVRAFCASFEDYKPTELDWTEGDNARAD